MVSVEVVMLLGVWVVVLGFYCLIDFLFMTSGKYLLPWYLSSAQTPLEQGVVKPAPILTAIELHKRYQFGWKIWRFLSWMTKHKGYLLLLTERVRSVCLSLSYTTSLFPFHLLSSKEEHFFISSSHLQYIFFYSNFLLRKMNNVAVSRENALFPKSSE